MTFYDLPNPFMQVSDAGIPVSDRTAAALEPDEPALSGGVAAEPVGYQCCQDCGMCDPCDEHCPNYVENSSCGGVESRHAGDVTQATGSAAPGAPPRQGDTILPMVLPAAGVATGPHEARFQLDEAALMSDIEPVPAFLTDNRAEQIEELLELARAEDWPAPPRRMVG